MPDRQFDKVIASVGERVEKDGEPLEFSGPLLARLVRSFEEMKARRVTVPLLFTHDEDVRNQAGEVTGLKVADGKLVARVLVRDGPDADKIGRTIRETSPRIKFDAVDGRGNKYPVAMLHLAMVSRPVIAGQPNFELASREFGLCFNLSLGESKMSMPPEQSKAMWANTTEAGNKKPGGNNWSLSADSFDADMTAILQQFGAAASPELLAAIKQYACPDAMAADMAAEPAEQVPPAAGNRPQPGEEEPLKRQSPNLLMSLHEMNPREKRGVELCRAGIRAQLQGLVNEGRVKPTLAGKLFREIDGQDFLLSLANEQPGASSVERQLEVILANSEPNQYIGGKPRTADYQFSLDRQKPSGGAQRHDMPLDPNADLTPLQIKRQINERMGKHPDTPVASMPGV